MLFSLFFFSLFFFFFKSRLILTEWKGFGGGKPEACGITRGTAAAVCIHQLGGIGSWVLFAIVRVAAVDRRRQRLLGQKFTRGFFVVLLLLAVVSCSCTTATTTTAIATTPFSSVI